VKIFVEMIDSLCVECRGAVDDAVDDVGGRKTENGRWRMGDGGWKMEDAPVKYLRFAQISRGKEDGKRNAEFGPEIRSPLP